MALHCYSYSPVGTIAGDWRLPTKAEVQRWVSKFQGGDTTFKNLFSYSRTGLNICSGDTTKKGTELLCPPNTSGCPGSNFTLSGYTVQNYCLPGVLWIGEEGLVNALVYNKDGLQIVTSDGYYAAAAGARCVSNNVPLN